MKTKAPLALLVAVIVLALMFLAVGCNDLVGATTSVEGTTDTAVQSTTTDTVSTPATGGATAQPTTTGAAPSAEPTTTTTLMSPALALYEETDPNLTWTGDWRYDSYDFYSGGRAALTETAGSSVTINFSGTSIAWLGIPWESYGMARVTLDGGALVALVDCYDPANVLESKVLWESGSLAGGSHTLTIECTNSKNPGSMGYWIDVDAFSVVGSIE